MRLTLSAYVSVERQEGRCLYNCQPLRGPQIMTRDPLLSVALNKLGNKMRKSVGSWIESGEIARLSQWLYDSETRGVTVKLTISLRDRTLRWKLLMVCVPAFSRTIAFSPSIPEVAFEVDSVEDLELRASEVYAGWAQTQVSAGDEHLLEEIGSGGEMWVEPLEVEVDTAIRNKKRSKNILAALFGGEQASGAEELHKVGHCLDEMASDYQPALGRRALVEEIDRLLQRDDRQGVLLVGPPAVGKTAIIHECVQRRAARYQQRRDHRPQVWWLSPQRLISGMSYLGQWEQRWLSILRESSKRDHVLYFDDLVGLFTAGRTRDSSMSAADVLQGFLAEHPLRLLAECTAEQLAVLRRRDRNLADRFHLIYVPALSAEDALPIALEASYDIEIRAERFFHPETVPLVMRHQETFAPDQAFPGKAIEMCKTLTKHASSVVDGKSLLNLAGTQMGASLALLTGQMGDQVDIQQTLEQHLIGQPAAVAALSRTVIRYAQRLQPPDRPLGVLLLLGPTGVGKTEAAKALTRLMYTDMSHLIRLDMNELTTSHAAEQLVGTFEAPDGRLTSAIRRQPNCVILLDEIEKAHPDVFDYLLQVLGEGRLTDARGRVADFRTAVIVMTSNLGASEQNASLGFENSAQRRQQLYLKAAQRFFRPEFFNRIDEVVPFRNLDAEDMQRIVAIQMDQVLSRDGIKRRDIFVHVDPSAIQLVIQRGYDAKLGARAVRRMLESQVIGPLGDCLSGMAVDAPKLIRISHPSSTSQLECHVEGLQIATTQSPRRLSTLEPLIERSEALYCSLDGRLSELEHELREIDRQATGQSHGASYYALREQLFRAGEAIKMAKVVHQRKPTPRLDVPPVNTSFSRREMDSGGARRIIKDWHAREDLRMAIHDQHTELSPELATLDMLARRVVDSLTVAKCMTDAALSARSWLIGFQSLTGGQAHQTPTKVERGRAHGRRHRDGNTRYLVNYDIVTNDIAASLLSSALQEVWQYEVTPLLASQNFYAVSGVSLLGLIGPILGTYRVEPIDASGGQASHLSALRAIPAPVGATPTELDNWLTEQMHKPIDAIAWPAEFRSLPTTTVRGELSQRMVDYISGASIALWQPRLADSPRARAEVHQWWINCLPVPSELQEA